MADSLVELVEVSIYVAESALSRGADHHVALAVELLDVLCCLVPLAEVCIAQACVEVGEIACLGAAVVVGYTQQTRESSSVALEGFLVLVLSE